MTATGSHAAPMEWAENGRADCAAIDSVVQDMEFTQRPERAAHLLVIETLGPAGTPPVVASSRLPDSITETLTHVHTTGRGQSILKQSGVSRFAPASNKQYDNIRQIVRALQRASVSQLC